jgi:hypothetical protein
MTNKAPILVWDYDDAPEEIRISTNGGDEDMIIAVPPGQEVPWRFQELGCCSNDFFTVDENGNVLIEKGSHGSEQFSLENPAKYKLVIRYREKTGFNCPNYKGWQFVIPCHA